MNVEHPVAQTASRRRPADAKRGLGMVGLAVLLTTAAGCAVSQAETLSPTQHRNSTSIFSSVAGVTTSEVTSEFPSTTTAQVVDGSVTPGVDGRTQGNLADLSQSAAWSIDLGNKIEGMRLGALHGSDSLAPMQVGNVMLVGLRSSVLNEVGTAAFSMTDGSLLWQDRSLECQRVDVGGAVPCRQNAGEWALFNPAAGVFGPAINPGFVPEAFGFADGVLYSARTNGAGMIEISAGSVAEPFSLWTVTVPRSDEAMIPGSGASITVADTIKVVMGAAEIELTKDGEPLTALAHPVQPEPGAMVIDIEQTIGDVHINNTIDDRINGGAWSIPSRVVSKHTVTDGQHLTFVAGDDADGSNVIRTISLADGHTVSEHSVVANAAEPRDIQSAAHGLFAYDKQFSRIAYYPAG